MKIGFLGLGLIGGSIARALKQHENKYQTYVYDLPKVMQSDEIRQAIDNHIIDFACDNISALKDCEIIFLCAPISVNISSLEQLKSILNKDCILTDVGSAKTAIQTAVIKLGLNHCFIGGHPMAGSEKTGFINSNAHLLENAYYILTPTDETNPNMIHQMKELIMDIGAIVVLLDPIEHDTITANISHLPHIIASTLVNLVHENDGPQEKMRLLAAGGFKDITRIASASPQMWLSICQNNPKSIETVLKQYIISLQKFLDAISTQNQDYLYSTFEKAFEYRSSIPNSKGILSQIFELYIDITDEPGAIAIIATLFGSHGISIKNIGIIHNREFEEGVLRVEFYKEEALKKARNLLKSHNYIINERH